MSMKQLSLQMVFNERELLSRLKFSVMFLRCFVPWPSVEATGKIYGDRPREPLCYGGGAINASQILRF